MTTNDNKVPYSSREVAMEVARFLLEKYGDNCTDPSVMPGMWLAMQLVGGPIDAAATLRQCGVNFELR